VGHPQIADEQLGTTLINPNRTWPGEESGNTVERQCWLITNRLINGNVDVGVDFHTGGTGSDFARFVFAYAKDAESLRMAELFPVDQIMADPGLPGTLEYALVQARIPALTVELGGPRGFDREMIRIGVEGAENLLAHYKITDTPVGQTAKDRNVFPGNDLEDIGSITGGFAELLVKLNDEVKKGQKDRHPAQCVRRCRSRVHGPCRRSRRNHRNRRDWGAGCEYRHHPREQRKLPSRWLSLP
jgi:predicted deacylase